MNEKTMAAFDAFIAAAKDQYHWGWAEDAIRMQFYWKLIQINEALKDRREA